MKRPEGQIWEKDDLVRRVLLVLDFAGQVIQSLPTRYWPDVEEFSNCPFREFRRKVIAETAMLLICCAHLQDVNEDLRERISRLAVRLAPMARSDAMLSCVYVDPGLAYNDIVAHAVISRLGHPDLMIDQFLVESKVVENRFGPEGLPLCRLEREWLARVWVGCTSIHNERGLLGRSILGRQMDILSCKRFDVYSFTHAIFYATDFGSRRTCLPRPILAITADADAALSLSLDIDDFDVAAELTMTWPMLGVAWSPLAIFAFGIMATIHDQLGFLPGPGFDLNRFKETSTKEQRFCYTFGTSYHTTYVMGMLCAVALRKGCRPHRLVPVSGSRGSGPAIASLLEVTAAQRHWQAAFNALSPGQQDSLAPLILTILLRQAKDRGDIRALRTHLKAALDKGLVELPAARQAVALLRRSALLNHIIQEKSCVAEFELAH